MSAEAPMADLEGNGALITASSSGLGKAAAEALAARGCDVVINGRTEEPLIDTAAELDAEYPGDVTGVVADITEATDVERLVNEGVERLDGLDHLVTSAGGPPSGEFLETSDEMWYDAFDLLVMSAVRAARHAAPALRADDGGTIVAITSRSVKEAIPGLVLSNAVRMGVVGLMKTLSREFAPEVRTNLVLPGPHETERSEKLHSDAVKSGEYDSYEAAVADTAASIPLDRIGSPRELGDAVAFLSSEQSSFINGVALPVDGGAGASNL